MAKQTLERDASHCSAFPGLILVKAIEKLVYSNIVRAKNWCVRVEVEKLLRKSYQDGSR